MKRDEKALTEAVARLEKSVARALEESGLTEGELADYFDLNKPPPEIPREIARRKTRRNKRLRFW